jgi:N-acetylglucosamine kinase-like BadF-type ATPase
MILIADSGSTKTDWRLSDGNSVYSFSSKGINPYFNTPEQIIQELHNSALKEYKSQISVINFYGAGLTGETIKENIKKCFSDFFKTDDIFVYDDLLAAARALFGDESGIACILGTGSNSCLYIDGVIVDKIPPLGYILGDEGSGADIGKAFLNALHKRKFPEKLREEILKTEDLSQNVILEKVYHQEQANRYLASLTQVMNKYIQHKEVKAIIINAFQDFFKQNISIYKNYNDYKPGFVGSIAFHFSELLAEVAESQNLSLGKIIKAPIDELLNYHLRKI